MSNLRNGRVTVSILLIHVALCLTNYTGCRMPSLLINEQHVHFKLKISRLVIHIVTEVDIHAIGPK